MEKIKDLTLLSDIFPTGYHGAVRAGVTTGSTVYIAGAGPVGLACAASAHLLARRRRRRPRFRVAPRSSHRQPSAVARLLSRPPRDHCPPNHRRGRPSSSSAT